MLALLIQVGVLGLSGYRPFAWRLRAPRGRRTIARVPRAVILLVVATLGCGTPETPERAGPQVAPCGPPLPAMCATGGGRRFSRLPSEEPPPAVAAVSRALRVPFLAAPPKGSSRKGEVIDLDEEHPRSAGDAGGPVTAGQMTEHAAVAKRLFDAERWGDAASALLEVASGRTGDDDGNRQIAEYHLMIAHYRLGTLTAAEDLALLVAEQPNHIKFNENLLWLAKLLTQCPSARAADAVDRYSFPTPWGDDVIARWGSTRSPQQTEMLRMLAYHVGRRRLERGERDAGAAMMAPLLDGGTLSEEARRCLAVHGGGAVGSRR